MLLIMGLIGLLVAPAFGQGPGRTDGASNLYSFNADANRIPALQNKVSLDLDRVALGDALKEIARQGGFGVSYSSDLVPDKQLVSLRIEQGSIAEALQALLSATDLSIFISPKGDIIITKSEEKQTVQAPYERLRALSLVNLTVEQTISGTVTDSESGEPIPGVNVVVENTTIGTATDADGTYSLTAPDDADVLVFSSIGYVTQRVRIDGRSEIDVTLDPDVAQMEEVVVVGYGTQQRAEVTGSVASVQAEDIQDIPVTSFQEAVQGKLPGVRVAQPTGEPGAGPTVQVRGTGSITAGNDPLYVIDGVPISRNEGLQGDIELRRDAFTPPSENPLAALNPNDIQSIEVLKDASSAAIYGSRGSNGVVLISTKSGNRSGRPTIAFNSYIGIQEATNVPDLMNAQELIEYTRDARNNNYVQEYQPENPNFPESNPHFNPDWDPTTNEGRPDDDFVLLPEKYIDYDGTDTNWLDLVLDPAPVASTNLSVAGGSETIGYYVSAGYLNQQGTIEGSAYKRYSLRANVDANPYERLNLGANVNVSLSQQDRLPAGSPYFARPPGIVYSAMVHSPVIQPFNEDGTPNQLDGQSYLGGGTTSASNPVAIINGINEDLDNHRTFGNAFVEYDITDQITAKSSFGADLLDYTRSFYRANSLLYRTAQEGEPFGQSGSSRSFNWVSENTLTYGNSFDDHDLTVLAGFTAQRERADLNSVIAQNFPDDEVQTINAGQVTNGTSLIEEWSLLSYLGRVNYSYLGRYLLTATVRADQSSRFGPGNRTGVFPSASVGWRISEEAFMDPLESVLSDLKVRLSYGVTGNFLIPNYGSFSLLNKENYNFNGDVVTATVPATLGDQDLTWETTRQVNIGVDAGLLEDRIYFSADYYNSRTSDLLLEVTLPSALGFTNVLTNIGVVDNQGFEFSATSRNLVGDFRWTTELNFATNRNEVVELGEEGDPILSVGGAGIRHITQIGSEIGSYYGYEVEGIYQSEEEIANAPDDILAQDPQPGDFRFRDVNGDGVIDGDDRTVIGSYQPDFTYGMTNRFSYKNVDLSVFIQGVQGREILNLTARHLKNGEANFNSYGILNERWRSPEDPGNGEVPRADRQTGIHGNNNRPSSYQVEDGSYLRIRNVTLGYRVPQSMLDGVMQSARLYVSGQNLFTFTDYIGFNPEVNNQATSSLTPGEDYGAYPLSRTYTVGVNLTF